MREEIERALRDEFAINPTSAVTIVSARYADVARVASEVAELRIAALQRALRVANSQLAPTYAPLTAFQEIINDAAMLAEVQEALR